MSRATGIKKWVDWVGIAGLFLFALSLVGSRAAGNLATLLMLIAALMSARDIWQFYKREPFFWLSVAFLVYVFAGALVAGLQDAGMLKFHLGEAYSLSRAWMALLLGWWLFRNPWGVNTWLLVVVAGGVLAILFRTEWQYFEALRTGAVRLGTLGMNPIFAGLLFSLVLFGQILFFDKWVGRFGARWFWAKLALWGLVFVLSGFAMFASQSRTAILASAVVLLPFFLFWVYQNRTMLISWIPASHRIKAAVVFLVLVFSAAYLLHGPVKNRLIDTRDELTALHSVGLEEFLASAPSDRATSTSGRIIMWAFGVRGWSEKPLFGWGAGALCHDGSLCTGSWGVDRSGGWGPVARCENGEIRASPIWELGPPVFYAKYAGCHHVHQSYLDLLLRTGVVGLLLFVGMGVRLLYLAARAFASTKSDRSMPFFFLAALCVFAVASLTDSLVFSQQGWMLLSLVAGIILATCRKKESHDSQ